MGCSIIGLVFIYLEWYFQDWVQVLLGLGTFITIDEKGRENGRWKGRSTFTTLEIQHH